VRFKDVFSRENIVGDIRNWAVAMIMTAALAIVVAVGLAVWKAFKQQPVSWTVFGLFLAFAIGLLVFAIIILRKRPEVSRSGFQRISDLLDTKIKEGEKALSAIQNDKFRVRCGPDLYSDNLLTSGVAARYLHAEVSINSGTVHGCKAYLTAITGGPRDWKGSEQLTFSPSEAIDTLSKAIFTGVSYPLDVLRITSDGEIHVCNHSREWARFPRLRDLFAVHGPYDLTVVLAGEDASGESFVLRFEWTGNWQASFLTNARPLRVRE